MKISDILKHKGLYSSDIKTRFKSGHLKINGETIKEDIEISVFLPNDLKTKQILFDAGDFIYYKIVPNKKWLLQCKIFGFENLFDSNIDNDLTVFLDRFNLIRISKKELFLIKK